jgi:hypothetical protein
MNLPIPDVEGMTDDDLKTALLLAFESELTPRLREIDERLRDNHILIRGVDYDVLSKRVEFTIELMPSMNAVAEHGTASLMETILNGVPGETVIHHQMRSKLSFHPTDMLSLIDLVAVHSYLLVNGTYSQELGAAQQY